MLDVGIACVLEARASSGVDTTATVECSTAAFSGYGACVGGDCGAAPACASTVGTALPRCVDLVPVATRAIYQAAYRACLVRERVGGLSGCPDGPTPVDGVGPAVFSGNTLLAGDDVEASCSGAEPGFTGADRVHLWTAPESRTYELDTFGSPFDTVLDVRVGACGGASVGCNDDAASGGTIGFPSLVSVDAIAGQTYAIIVEGSLADQAGAYVVNVTAR